MPLTADRRDRLSRSQKFLQCLFNGPTNRVLDGVGKNYYKQGNWAGNLPVPGGSRPTYDEESL